MEFLNNSFMRFIPVSLLKPLAQQFQRLNEELAKQNPSNDVIKEITGKSVAEMRKEFILNFIGNTNNNAIIDDKSKEYKLYLPNKQSYRFSLTVGGNEYLKPWINTPERNKKLNDELLPKVKEINASKAGNDYIPSADDAPLERNTDPIFDDLDTSTFIPILEENFKMLDTEVIPITENFTRESVKKDSDYMYLFTDNSKRTSGSNKIIPNWYTDKYKIQGNYPTMTQAVIRGLENAFPITTMVDDRRTQWKDSQFEEYKSIIDSEIDEIHDSIQDGDFKGIKFSGLNPFGKGKISNMKESAPKIWNYLNQKLKEIGIDNTGDLPKVIENSEDMIQINKQPRTIAIIGTAGRSQVPTLTEWNNMLEDAKSRVSQNDTLISGGAAFADHIAVKLFLEGKVKELKLRLPAKISNGKFIGKYGTAGGTANFYHDKFSKVIGINTIEEIQQAINKGAEVTYETEISNKAMFIRNDKVAKESNAMIAYTYGESNEPADGGTKDTWNKSKYSDKVHVSIHKIKNINEDNDQVPDCVTI
jgi:hypothetical protein